MAENRFMFRLILLSFLFLLSSLTSVSAQVRFSGVNRGYVPEGKGKRHSKVSTVEQCQAACATDEGCKAYAFRPSKPACYFYSRVYMGGTKRSRELGIISAGLSVVSKSGFVSALENSSFPISPDFVKRPD
jgi:hypothetical protein